MGHVHAKSRDWLPAAPASAARDSGAVTLALLALGRARRARAGPVGAAAQSSALGSRRRSSRQPPTEREGRLAAGAAAAANEPRTRSGGAAARRRRGRRQDVTCSRRWRRNKAELCRADVGHKPRAHRMRLAARWGATAALLVIAALGSVVAGATPRVWADMPDMEVLDAYRLAAREKTSLLREQAGVDALRIACATGGTVLFLFLAGSAGCYRMGARSSQSLHDFTLRHHQDADSIDVSTGAKERLDTVHNRHHDDGEEGYSPVTGSTLLNSSSYSAFRDTSNASNGKTKDVLETRTVVEKRVREGARLQRKLFPLSTMQAAVLHNYIQLT